MEPRPNRPAKAPRRQCHPPPRRDRDLVPTAATLQQPPARHRIGLRMSAPRPPIPVRPPGLHEVSPAGVLRSKTHLELGKGLREVGTRHPPVLLPPTTTYGPLLSRPDR